VLRQRLGRGRLATEPRPECDPGDRTLGAWRGVDRLLHQASSASRKRRRPLGWSGRLLCRRESQSSTTASLGRRPPADALPTHSSSPGFRHEPCSRSSISIESSSGSSDGNIPASRETSSGCERNAQHATLLMTEESQVASASGSSLGDPPRRCSDALISPCDGPLWLRSQPLEGRRVARIPVRLRRAKGRAGVPDAQRGTGHDERR
jgi:hypothetical protein